MRFSSESEFFIDKVIKKVQLERIEVTPENELLYKKCIFSLIDDLV